MRSVRAQGSTPDIQWAFRKKNYINFLSRPVQKRHFKSDKMPCTNFVEGEMSKKQGKIRNSHATAQFFYFGNPGTGIS